MSRDTTRRPTAIALTVATLAAGWLAISLFSRGSDAGPFWAFFGTRMVTIVLLLSLLCVGSISTMVPAGLSLFAPRRLVVIGTLAVALTLLPAAALLLDTFRPGPSTLETVFFVSTEPLYLIQTWILAVVKGVETFGARNWWTTHLHKDVLMEILPFHLATAIPFWAGALLAVSAGLRCAESPPRRDP